ncbi:RNA-binding protein [Candidatus Woesearchaeota archaeon]|nr:MAG: RNA-binding protein [Candidatus Woesearchaeota archaeon]
MSPKKNNQELFAKIQIGKNGITDNVVIQIKRYVKKHGMVKIKMLKSFMEAHDKKASADELAKRTNTRLVCLTGFTITLEKSPRSSGKSLKCLKSLKKPMKSHRQV